MMRPGCAYACALLVACSGQDIDIGHGAPGSLEGRTNLDAGGPLGAGIARDRASAIVIRSADLPIASSTSSTVSGGVSAGVSGSSASATGPGGSAIDPDLRYVFIGNGPPTCTDPAAGALCDFFRVTIRVPSVLFVPGVHFLADARILATYSTRGPARDGGDCEGGGGDFVDGTFEIVETGSALTVRLMDTVKPGFDADGSYPIAQCL